jgi:Tol biopolymer transport system component
MVICWRLLVALGRRLLATDYRCLGVFMSAERMIVLGGLMLTVLLVPVIGQQSGPGSVGGPTKPEPRLGNIRQLTSGGENAEAYFSADGQRLIFQNTADPTSASSCDQIYTMRVDGSEKRKISMGGRTTCGYFYPDGQTLLYASTHLASPDCPPRPSFARGYVWPIYASYDVFRAKPDGSGLQRLTSAPGYDAEATVGPNGRIVFTSVRDGDMEIYSMAGDGSDVRRLTNRPGPDGGPFFSADGRQIVFRGRAISAGPELDDFRSLLKEELWRPTTLEIFVMNADGSNLRQVSKLGGANFAPFFHPDGKRIIFASNHHDPKGRDFDIYLMNVDGTGLERITNNETFDGFPMFSPDGRRLVFASNRGAKSEGETNVFLADWVGN